MYDKINSSYKIRFVASDDGGRSTTYMEHNLSNAHAKLRKGTGPVWLFAKHKYVRGYKIYSKQKLLTTELEGKKKTR
ncbi:hypothetical protein RRG08_005735 [Elysia crispata]|uniref:Uncharacterized protein n=1 Tax=Elysia crispata TaxID=231223 RepID=A0AAE0YEB6_9GAST|nr:hypothetical protein RRG08_005735 [Elysia crispata]